MGITYVNPYCSYCRPIVVGSGVLIDYSQPLIGTIYIDPAEIADYPTGTPMVSSDAVIFMDSARAAFRRGAYDLALQYTNSALALMPRDRAMHEFRALVLFALRRYPDAAMTLHAVLAAGPGWDWTTLSGLYPNVNIYTAQLRELEAYQRLHPEAAETRFLLGYFYMTGGYDNAAADQFREVVRLLPNDAVAAQLLETLSPRVEQPQVAVQSDVFPTPEEVETPTSNAVTRARLLGSWKTMAPDGTSIVLTIIDESNFAWVFTRDGKSSTISGSYTLGQSTLMLNDPKTGPMLGQITFHADNSFTFKMPGAPAGEGTLVFRR